jgi:dTDP-glucose 4,6-dehydratase
MILITGADGFIGSHLAETLVKQGKKVKAFVYYNSFNSWGWLDHSPYAKDMEIFSGDVRDSYAVKEAIKGCSHILNLAALIGIPYSYYSPNSYVDTNINGVLNLLNAARDQGVEKFVHTSTSEVYGTANYVPIDEKHPLNAQSPYAASKIGADQLALSFFQSFNMPISIVRPFNTYGPRQSARAVLPTVISQILQDKKKVKLGKISPTRDFNFIEDTISGFISALNAENDYGEVINIGSNFEISIEDSVNIIANILNKDIFIDTDENRIRPDKSEVERLWCDNSKAKELYGWKPKFAGIEGFTNGLTSTIDWFSNKDNLSKYKADIYNI